ncbi:MAG: hypothetical protein K0R73_127 [Candidatus Midichloriaceae bacterium]|jgi:hypothetical protein|nr:hypothetical protein [Candidatus Midichloriaceae bacterium]
MLSKALESMLGIDLGREMSQKQAGKLLKTYQENFASTDIELGKYKTCIKKCLEAIKKGDNAEKFWDVTVDGRCMKCTPTQMICKLMPIIMAHKLFKDNPQKNNSQESEESPSEKEKKFFIDLNRELQEYFNSKCDKNRNLGYLLNSVGAGGTFFLTYCLNAPLLCSPVTGKDAFTGFVISALLGVISADHPNFPLIRAAEYVLLLESACIACIALCAPDNAKSTLTGLAFAAIAFAAIDMHHSGCVAQYNPWEAAQEECEKIGAAR